MNLCPRLCANGVCKTKVSKVSVSNKQVVVSEGKESSTLEVRPQQHVSEGTADESFPKGGLGLDSWANVMLKRVDPSEGNQTHAALERASPVPAGVGPVVLDPVLEPVETMLAAATIPEQPAGLRQSHWASPAAWLPERLDCRAVGQLAVVESERRFAGGDIDRGKVVALPVRRRVYLYVEVAEEAKSAGGNALGVALQRLAE